VRVARASTAVILLAIQAGLMASLSLSFDPSVVSDVVDWLLGIQRTLVEAGFVEFVLPRCHRRLYPALAAICHLQIKPVNEVKIGKGGGGGEEAETEAEAEEVDEVRLTPLREEATAVLANFPDERLDCLFLLAGQSNMAGRGVDTRIPIQVDVTVDVDETAASTQGYYFDPLLGWTKIEENASVLHKHVDLLKEAGFGIGNTFHRHFGRESKGQYRTIGLVPVAVGGTSLCEWTASYLSSTVTADCEFDDEGFLLAPRNARYHQGCCNLLSCALRSLWLAMQSSQHAMATGVLWYQGENDCTLDEAAAHSYGDRFLAFWSEFKFLHCVLVQLLAAAGLQTEQGLPRSLEAPASSLPIVTVAVTSTRTALMHLTAVRQQQLALKRSRCQEDSIVVVDAFGCALKNDNIHITTLASTRLAAELARSMLKLLQDPSSCDASSSHSFLDDDFDEASNSSFQAAREAASSQVTSFYQAKDEHEKKQVLPIIKITRESGLKAVNFVCGEVGFADIQRVLHMILETRHELPLPAFSGDECVFVDLGSGEGGSLAAAALLSPRNTHYFRPSQSSVSSAHFRVFTRVWGIELNHSKVLQSKALASCLGLTACQCQVSEMNFLDADWSAVASVVYACATCFSPDLLVPTIEKLKALRPGARVVLMDKILEEPLFFQLVASCQCNTSWGYSSAFVYVRC